MLSGDLYHYPEERTLGRMPEREKTTDTAASRAALEAFMKEVKAELWIAHDISRYSKQRKSPEYLTNEVVDMDFPHAVIARLYEHIEPIDRGERYEDPRQARLEQQGNLGRVTGGGSQLNESGGIAHADIEIELANLDAAVRVVAEALEAAGAPRGPSSSTCRTARC